MQIIKLNKTFIKLYEAGNYYFSLNIHKAFELNENCKNKYNMKIFTAPLQTKSFTRFTLLV